MVLIRQRWIAYFDNVQIPTEYDLNGITFNLAKKNYVKRAHRRNIYVQFWTINDKEEMRKLINIGADVIVTDNPDIMYELLKEMGILKNQLDGVKILGNGTLEKKLTVKANQFSKKAKEEIEKLGGKAEVI